MHQIKIMRDPEGKPLSRGGIQKVARTASSASGFLLLFLLRSLHLNAVPTLGLVFFEAGLFLKTPEPIAPGPHQSSKTKAPDPRRGRQEVCGLLEKL